MKVVALASPAALDEVDQPADWPRLTSAELAAQAPDATWIALNGNQVAGRVSAWWTNAPRLPGESLGAVGHFAASSREAATRLLATACDALRARGATLAVGPMDGNTWRRYRLVIDAGTEPPFFLEPTNPPEWPRWFADAGWRIHSEYVSSVNDNLDRPDPAGAGKAKAIADRGVTLRDLRLEDYDAELRRIYSVARVSFASAYLYTPIDEAEFVAQYRVARAAVVPSLVTIAEHEGRTVGFCFCVPDVNERMQGRPARTAILKTFAVLPGYGGLGGALADRTHNEARRLGFTRVIHALMHVSNDRSRALSKRIAHEIRRYALFERRVHEI
ncbi:MAG: GNAT family N-acetyltransferase [Gemmatimonadaceae bacterium]